MRVIGLDWGEVRIGISVSDPLGITAQPLFSINNDENFTGKLKEIIKKYDASEIVLGYPKSLSGKPGISADKVKGFYEKLSSEVQVKVTLWDERFTTKIALQSLAASGVKGKKGKGLIDASASGIMLQSYIDSKRT